MAEQRKVILVDDDEDTLRVLARQLRNHFEVVTTDNPRALMAMVRYERPDIVLCDIDMPAMTGAEVVRALASDPTLPAVPVIYVTSLADADEIRRQGGSLGGVPAFAKGEPVTRLVLLIEQVLGMLSAPGQDDFDTVLL